jgi:hypothetical protein
MWFDVPGIEIHQRVPENGRRDETRSEKKLANRICATSPYWADESLGAIVMKIGL